MSEKIQEQNQTALGETPQERRIPLDSFVEGEKTTVPILDSETAALRERTIASLKDGVDEATRKLFSLEAPRDSREEAERILREVHIHNLAQIIGWKEAERYGEEVKAQYVSREDIRTAGGTSGSLSKTARVLRSLFSSF